MSESSNSKVNPGGVLAGKVAVVTGASRGIGDAIARRFAMEGAKVVVSARTVDSGEHYLPGTINETVAAIRAAGGEALGVKADLAAAEDRERLIAAAEAEFGPVDILVNNAAITYFIPVADFPEKRFRLMTDVQVWAPFELAQRVLPGMQEKGSGWILNISSHAAIHPTPGVMHHKLIKSENEDRVTPVEHMAEACLRLCHGDPQALTGRIDYADEVMQEFDLQAAELI